MIPNHTRFLEAIQDRKKVCVQFYSNADKGILNLVCAPMDYGPGENADDNLNRYWLWDYSTTPGPKKLGLVAGQIVDLAVLGELFDPAGLGERPKNWSIPRDWNSQPPPLDASTGTVAVETATNSPSFKKPD
jgi:hypothetical protein